VPHARAWAEPIPRDDVETASRAPHSVPDGYPVQELENSRITFLKAEALNLNVRALLDRPHLRCSNASRSQRSERDRCVGWLLAPHLDNPGLSVPVPVVFVPHWVTIAESFRAISRSRSAAAC
jgi:hypothetical protein